jgi:hypothetical protein
MSVQALDATSSSAFAMVVNAVAKSLDGKQGFECCRIGGLGTASAIWFADPNDVSTVMDHERSCSSKSNLQSCATLVSIRVCIRTYASPQYPEKPDTMDDLTQDLYQTSGTQPNPARDEFGVRLSSMHMKSIMASMSHNVPPCPCHVLLP